MKIAADNNIPFLKGLAEKFGEVVYLSGSEFTKDAIKDIDVLIVRTVTYFGKEILENSNVKLICSATIGYDHIDTIYCEQHAITWKNAPGCNSGSVQQYIASALIEIAMKKNFELKNKTIGIVGVGNVGKKVAEISELLGLKVLLCDPPRQRSEQSNIFVDLDVIKNEADIISFHTPLIRGGIDRTFHLANKEFFKTLRKKPIIINAARGAIVDTQAIKEALRSNQIRGAVIDCWEEEPFIDTEYMHMVDIATPHIAGYSADGKANATSIALKNIAEFYGLEDILIPKPVIPHPSNDTIDLSRFEDAKAVESAILTTYSSCRDHDLFIKDPDSFSNQRSHYQIRREYSAYTIINGNPSTVSLLKKIGFRYA